MSAAVETQVPAKQDQITEMSKYMPAFGEKSAPTFNEDKPRELPRFFAELERLFKRDPALTDTEKKADVLRYLDYDLEQVWRTIPEYDNLLSTYEQFKAAVYVYYPNSTGDFVYSMREKEAHVQKYKDEGINSADDLQRFHLRFLAITNWLVKKEQMGIPEQRREYMKSFSQPLLGEIKGVLRAKFLNRDPNTPHKIEDVYDAARIVLLDKDLYPEATGIPVQPRSVPPAVASPSSSGFVKQETFALAMADLSRTISDALQQGNRSRITGPTARNTDCNFCGGPHFIRECKVVDEYIVAGKCRRNFEGKVILSSGAFVPKDIPGTLLRERVDEWHHRNPNQLSTATMVHTISAEHVQRNTVTASTPVNQLTTAERIVTLEAELFNLRARRPAFVPAIRTRAQKARELPLATIEEVSEEEDAPARKADGPQIIVTTPKRPSIVQGPEVIVESQPAVEPEHPFRSAKDAAYAPPTTRNVGAVDKVPVAKAAAAPAYRSLPPVHDPNVAATVYKRAMDASVTITQRELLSLSPEVRAQMRDSTTTRRIPTAPIGAASVSLQAVVDEDDVTVDTAPSFVLRHAEGFVPPPGSLVITDPILAYYESLEPGEIPNIDRLTVARESTAIRSVYALVDACQKKECTVDPGCQVVAMSEATCHSLGLAYDPAIRLHMESANGTMDWSLGLARNVTFLIGTITVYLQAHIIRSPSYEILLGRPFDVLTESVIRNFNNEDQTITITDPNSGNKCTVPTFARGAHPAKVVTPQDF